MFFLCFPISCVCLLLPHPVIQRYTWGWDLGISHEFVHWFFPELSAVSRWHGSGIPETDQQMAALENYPLVNCPITMENHHATNG